MTPSFGISIIFSFVALVLFPIEGRYLEDPPKADAVKEKTMQPVRLL